MIKRILVALSGTPYTDAAVHHAMELARTHGASLTGVTVANVEAIEDVGPIPVGGGAAAVELAGYRKQVTVERVEQAIDMFEAECVRTGTDHAVVREEGDPFEELISLWRYHDLTVVGLRGMFEYGVVHNPDDYLIMLMKQGVRPVVAVTDAYRPVKRVLIAYSGSMGSAKSMKRFVQSQPWPNTTVKVVSFDRRVEEGDELLADAATYCRAHGLEVETEHVLEAPRHALLAHADQWEADLIVMGSSRRSRLMQHVLGDTALTAIQQAKVPLYLSQ